MIANKELHRELVKLLEDVSAAEIYCLLDECMYELVLSADHQEDVKDLGSRYIALRQLRDVFMNVGKSA